MRSPIMFLLALTAAAAVLGIAAVAGAQAPAPAVTPQQASALGAEAYVYGFPLLEFLRVRATATSVRCPNSHGEAPINSFSTGTRFANAADRGVVAPNVDTLYSVAQLDLGRGPVVLSHPDMGHRYFVFELVDPYSNVIAYIGARTTGAAAGRFAITWTRHSGRSVPGARVIRSDYRRVWVIGRTLALGPADQRRAVALMRRYTLAPPGGPLRFAPGCRPGRAAVPPPPTALEALDELGTALAQNPPPPRDAPLLAQLRAVGVGPGLSPQHAGLAPNVVTALAAGVEQEVGALLVETRLDLLDSAQRDHGWAIPASDIGDFGTDYAYRAEVALVGFGANTPPEAIYPIALTDSAGSLLDGATSSYELTFPAGQAPPVRAFWSLTMYDANGQLVANPIGRYAVGSSHPPLIHRSNGSIVIIVSHARPRQRGVNWLPATHGPFRLNLRLYWPRAAALSGRWQPPPVTPVPSP
ncbi:MAG: DUF1254 domain-containing protein [Solirubrobacteraceae bacterium]